MKLMYFGAVSIWGAMTLALALALVIFISPTNAQIVSAESNAGLSKFALVIGNGHYSGNRRNLKNPVNDSKLMAQSLRKLGFDVKRFEDLDRKRLIKTIAEFADGLPEGATSLVFYAGHGMQIGGANYLVPVDMLMTSEQSVPLRAYPLKALLERVAASKSSVNIVVLDACRDNPFQPENPVRYRNFSRLGLAPIQAPVGTLVAYSTSPGQLSADGNEANSIYSSALAQVILEPELSLEAIFKKVGVLVRNKTRDDQIPWFESSLSEEYFFLPPEGVTMVAGRKPLTSDARFNQKSSSRSIENVSVNVSDDLWFRVMDEAQWTLVDKAIEQRLVLMTPLEIAVLERKASGGNVLSQTTLALYWLADSIPSRKIIGFEPSHQAPTAVKARSLLRMAAKAGFAVAQTELAQLYASGNGVPLNLKESRRLLELAVHANYPRAKQVMATHTLE